MSWNEIAHMGLTVRPFSGPKPPLAGAYSRFDTTLGKTLNLLRRELEMLGATQIVVELDVRDRDIRLDGYPRADSRPLSPAVAVSFKSKHGPLRYATAEYTTWQDNVRAIALSLEALRMVDRYGVSKRGEQYRGWKELAAGPVDPVTLVQTRDQAWEVICREGDLPLGASADIDEAIRRALLRAHPDRGGTDDRFRLVQRAREVLGAT